MHTLIFVYLPTKTDKEVEIQPINVNSQPVGLISVPHIDARKQHFEP